MTVFQRLVLMALLALLRAAYHGINPRIGGQMAEAIVAIERELGKAPK